MGVGVARGSYGRPACPGGSWDHVARVIFRRSGRRNGNVVHVMVGSDDACDIETGNTVQCDAEAVGRICVTGRCSPHRTCVRGDGNR